ncbi:PRKR-interacting protein 1 [Clonorchis sinensis]|uniref:PRKR-interacting protein 1 n=2 Tax=Clonorchis sinensis TaxID=79923 RepID=G7YNT6_CLOSI|nr:PRKR-interacting protein 1 [Clonorchis sinensis]
MDLGQFAEYYRVLYYCLAASRRRCLEESNPDTMAFYKKPDEDESLNEKDPEGIKRGEYRKMGIYDFVRRDIERYHAHPEEAIVSPELLKSKELKPPPEFVRNVWGSAAGVGSGDFHIYRGIRRREYARLEYIEKTAEEEKLNKEFQERQRILDEAAEAKTAKKRLKRQKKKAKRIASKLSKEVNCPVFLESGQLKSTDSDSG